MSTPEESTSHAHHHDDSPNTQASTTHTVLSFLEQATSREGRPDSTLASTVIGTAHNMLHRSSSPPSSTHHAHATQSPESLLDAAASSSAPTVLGAAQNMFSKLTHATTPHATPVPQIQPPIPEVRREQAGEASLPTEGPQQLSADLTAQGHFPRSVSSRGGGNGEGRAITPPRGVARITRSNPAPPEAMHLPRPIRLSHSHRRPTGTYANSEAEWDSVDDKDLYHEKCVSKRISQTIKDADKELKKYKRIAKVTHWLQSIAIGLQVLIGALTTALGAALSGKKSSSVAISLLGGASTLIASYLARMKGTNEPQASQFRAQALKHFLREIRAFDLDHGHEFGKEWDDRINGFRLGLERILGNQPGSVTIDASNMANIGNNPGVGVDLNVGRNPSGNGKYTTPMNTKTGLLPQ